MESAAVLASGLCAAAEPDAPATTGRGSVPALWACAAEVVYLHLPVRRTESARLLGPQAGCPLGGPRPLPRHPHGGSRLPRRRTDAAAGPTGRPLRRPSLP